MAQFDFEIESLNQPGAWPDRCARCNSSDTTVIPVPARYAKRTDGFALPLCERHADDWATVGFRTRVAVSLWFLTLAGGMIGVWYAHPHVARPHEQNELSRWSSAIFFGILFSFPVGGLLAYWAKTPIRVLSVTGRFATIAGVCRDFARSFASSPAATPVAARDAPRFDVEPYDPKPVVPLNKAGNALAILFVLAATLGVALGLGGIEIQRETAGWDKNDWRFAALACGFVLAYTVPLIGVRFLFSRFGGCLLFGILAASLVGLGLVRLFVSVNAGLGFAYSVPPLILIQFLAQRLVWRWKLRSTPIAVAAGSGSALVLAAFTFMLAGTEAGPHKGLYGFGILFAILGAALGRSNASTPFCAECDEWLEGRRIGALPKSILEVQPIVAGGQIVALADVKPYEAKANIGDVELKVFCCMACRERGTVVLELHECKKGGKNGNQAILAWVGRWLYPGAALPAIEALYPPPAPPLDSNVPAD